MNMFKLPPATVRGNAHLKLKAKLLSTVTFPGTFKHPHCTDVR